MPQGHHLSVFRGHSVEIPLRAIGRASSQLKFLIRSQPAGGRLGKILITGPKSAVVTYVADDSARESEVSFAYAVQGADTPVSASARVIITISEEPPALAVVHSLDFGRLLLGETREEQITIRNAGGGVLSGKIVAPEPWKIIGSPDYHLARKREQEVRILFQPTGEGLFNGRLTFTHDARSTVDLTGTAVSPFAFSPSDEIELSHTDAGSMRSAALTIRNATPFERSLEISAPPGISAPKEITIAPDTETRLPLHTLENMTNAIEGPLEFESEGYHHTIHVRAYPLRPTLNIEPNDGLDFGEIQPGRRYKSTLLIENRGGSNAHLKVGAPTDILLVPDPNSMVLAPGEKRLFEVALESRSNGEYHRKIEIGAEGVKTLQIPVSARIAGSAVATPKVPTAKLAPSMPEPREAGAPPEPHSDIPPIKKVTIHKLINRNLEVSWEKPAPNVVGYVVEQRMVAPEPDGSIKISWQKRRGIKFLEDKDTSIARFENLAQGQTWYLRIRSVNETGLRSEPSPTFYIGTPPPPKTGARWLIAILVLAGGITAAVMQIRRRRRAAEAIEADRIARLDNS
jgi:hypothetical protein